MLPYALKNKKPATVQITYILKFKINITGKKERKTKELLTLFSSGLGDLGWHHVPGARAGWVPRGGSPGAEGAGEGMPANQPPSPVSRSCGTLLQQH